MKYEIHNLSTNSYFVVESFDKMIEWFARQNKHKTEIVRDSEWSWARRYKDIPIEPKIHRYQDYNRALKNIAMNPNEYYTTWDYDWNTTYTRRFEKCTIHHREIMVKDELGRTIDPRHYWDIIATTTIKTNYVGWKSYRRFDNSYTYRRDPVPRTRKWRGGRSTSGIHTFQERKLSCDPEIKEYIKPRRNMMNLPSGWDQGHRNTNHCWKAKRIDKQWMKHQ